MSVVRRVCIIEIGSFQTRYARSDRRSDGRALCDVPAVFCDEHEVIIFRLQVLFLT